MKIKKCKLCGNHKIQNISPREFIHILCPECKGHYYKNEWWDKKHWDAYINMIEFNIEHKIHP